MACELLFEIGTEEIPSDYLENGLAEMKRLAEAYLKDSRIHAAEPLLTLGTPRRLVLIGRGISEKQEDVTQEVIGPPRRAGYDDKGNPTKAAIGFAQKQGIPVEDLQCVETPRGEYLFVRRMIPGRPSRDMLAELLPRLVADLPWPKSMRWGSRGFPFVRPIHWIVALLDGSVVPFELAGIRSNNRTRGHRFMGPRDVEVSGVEDYLRKVEEGRVIIRPDERMKQVETAVLKAAEAVSGVPVLDPELLATVTNMVEYPTAVCGGFDPAFLSIPDPVLITAMKKHQKYFALRDRAGRLMPNFVAVNNTTARDETVVRKGHERVLRARLSDASFFFGEDRKEPLLERLERLKGVVYHAELGTSFAKVERFTRLAEYLARQIAPQRMDEVRLAARLAKCDLVTEMVMEFPTLQGVMGREYARLDGHPGEVCAAIHEHYLPERAGGDLPSSAVGAIVGVADRMDTIGGFFAIQLEPTGAADPFALRRHALAIIRIMEHMGWGISLKDLIARSLSILGEKLSFDREVVGRKIQDFFRERYRQMMLRSEHDTDLVEAVISVEFDRIQDLRFRIEQLARFASESSEFQSLVLTFKRVTNILKNQEPTFTVDPALFRHPSESALWDAYQSVKDRAVGLIQRKDYLGALNLIAGLRSPVDGFFEGVEILTKEDPRVKENRVALLHVLSRFFTGIADFSKFSI
ncbi:MAG: glycine--tRNA ligase subunit beta [Thermodesulfobacteriota bacterium]